MSMLFKRIKDWATSITSFRTGDVIPVDGPSGTAKMSKDDLLLETAKNYAISADVMEMGDISMHVDSLTYTTSSSRARTPEDNPVSLRQGDKIFAKAGWQFYVAYSADGNAPYTVAGWLTSFTAPSNVKVHLLARLFPEVTAEKNIITSGIFTSSTSSELSVSQIEIKDLLQEAAENSAIFADVMEMGNIGMNVNSLNYVPSSSRARTPEDNPVSLRQGDKIFAKAGWQFYVAYSADGNAPYTVAGWLTSFIAQSNIKVHLLIRLASEVTAAKNILTSGIFTSSTSSELSVSQIEIIHDGDIRKSAFSDTLDGNGTTPVTSTFYARPNTTICIVLDKVDWHVTGIEAGKYKFVIRYFKADNSYSNIIALEDADLCDNAYFIQVPSDAVRMQVFIRMDVGESLTYCVYPAPNKSDKLDSRTAIVKGVNHRGYNNIAPENTLPAFRLSAKMGFGYVETDVQKTSDEQLVCIHDSTVDRTSNGTGNVADMTLEQLKALDFGSWKSAAYAGTKIPTFAEFLVCCRNLGLHAYIELKVANTEQQIVQMVEAYGMKGRVSYISYGGSNLEKILLHDPKARVGLVRDNVTASDITWCESRKTQYNEVFLDVSVADLSNAVSLCKAALVPLEVYTVTRSQISLADDYISGFTSNNCDASVVKYGEELLK